MRIVLFFTLLLSFSSFGQTNFRDSSINTVIIGLHYKATLPGGDLADRWGFHNQIGTDGTFKFKNNVTVGANVGFLFGNQLMDSTIFKDLVTEAGTITGLSGAPARILFLMRGISTHLSAGYVFNKLGNNPNSGLWLSGGLGYYAHKIRIENIYDNVPQLQGNYKLGYDKLTMGVSSRQFIGYLFQADRRLLKFYVGFEFTQALTRNVRTYNFDTGGPENDLRLDLSYGLKAGWIIPINQRTKSQYYY